MRPVLSLSHSRPKRKELEAKWNTFQVPYLEVRAPPSHGRVSHPAPLQDAGSTGRCERASAQRAQRAPTRWTQALRCSCARLGVITRPVRRAPCWQATDAREP